MQNSFAIWLVEVTLKKQCCGQFYLLNCAKISSCFSTLSLFQNFTAPSATHFRCGTPEELVSNGCQLSFMEFPISEVRIHKNKPLSKGPQKSHSDVTQISPQKLTLLLRPGKWHVLLVILRLPLYSFSFVQLDIAHVKAIIHEIHLTTF